MPRRPTPSTAAGSRKPEATEEHPTHLPATHAHTDASLNALTASGVLADPSIKQTPAPTPRAELPAPGPVPCTYPTGPPETQALAHDLLDAITVNGFPLPPPHPLHYTKAPARYNATAPALLLAGGITGYPNWQLRAMLQLDANGLPSRRPQPPPHRPPPPASRTRHANRPPRSTNTSAPPT
ncbi:hypothetical protein [Streptomyces curacoi]|uniref:hypothetical protein n=1 Tax=Streptomyces curacoi TaxID=146536 RepID=UPI000AC5B5B8|nr:hypothetical protein [Streptomyces curacoi]